MTKVKKLDFDVEENIISLDASYRGGEIRVDVSDLFPNIDDPIMGAYQNYLGGGLRGGIVGAAMFEPEELKTKKERDLFEEVEEKIKRYFHSLNQEEDDMNDEWNTFDYEKQQSLPVSAY